MPEIAIALTMMHLSGVPESSATERLLCSIAEAMEREFEATLGPLLPVVAIGRIDVDIVLDQNQAHNLAAIAARKIVTHIVSAVSMGGAHIVTNNTATEALTIDDLCVGDDRAATLLAAAQALRAGSGHLVTAPSRRPMSSLVATDKSYDVAHDRMSETASFSRADLLELLARIARSGRLERFARALMREGVSSGGAAAREMLRQIKTILLRLSRGPGPTLGIDDLAVAIVESHDARAWHTAVVRARSRLQARIARLELSAPDLQRFPALLLLFAIAEEGRLEQERILRTPAIIAAVLEAIEEIEDVESSIEVLGGKQSAVNIVRADSNTEPSQETPRDGHGAPRIFKFSTIHTNVVPQPSKDPAERSQDSPEYAGFDTQRVVPSSTIETPAGSALLEFSELVDPEVEAPIVCNAAGLVFLAGPLLDLGWVEAVCAIRDDPTISLVSMLRQILADVGADEGVQADPATWLLAGLAADPLDDDLTFEADTWSLDEVERLARAGGGAAATLADACGVWARAVIAETRLRLGGDGVEDLGRDVILVAGTILAEAERVTVSLPYPDSYGSLLRAGLLRDIPMVPWLGGRSLRLVFVGSEHGEPP